MAQIVSKSHLLIMMPQQASFLKHSKKTLTRSIANYGIQLNMRYGPIMLLQLILLSLI